MQNQSPKGWRVWLPQIYTNGLWQIRFLILAKYGRIEGWVGIVGDVGIVETFHVTSLQPATHSHHHHFDSISKSRM